MRADLLASLLADDALAAAAVPWACPCDFGPGGRYRLEELVGASPRSLVYRAVDTHMCSDGFRAAVVIKVFPAGPSGEHEALTGRRVTHPAVLAVLDRGSAPDGSEYVVVEYAAGGDLSQRRVPMAPREAARIIGRLALGVQAAHSAGVVHCDLKPSNVLLTAEGEPKLADFDLALREGSAGGGRRGNAAFMSPEQYRGDEGANTPPSDIYALGGLLYYLLSGKLPHGDTAQEVAATHAHQRSAPRSGADAVLDRLLGRAMAHNRDLRYHSAGELADDLQRWLDREPVPWVHTGLGPRVVLWARRRPVRAVLAATLLIAAAASGSAWGYAREHRRRADERGRTQAVRIANERVEQVSEAMRANIRMFVQVTLGGNKSDLRESMLPALVWLDWLGRSPVLAADGDPTTSVERVTLLRALIAASEAAGHAGELEHAMARYALAYMLVSVGEPADQRAAASLVADVQREWTNRLPQDDSFLLAAWGVEQAALASEECRRNPDAAMARVSAARDRVGTTSESVTRLLDAASERIHKSRADG